jgi:RimJ/RimL family protein N-acetyltransferase
MIAQVEITIRLYSEGDLWLLQRTLGDASQMLHLGGPENEDMLRKRHEKFLVLSADPGKGCMFVISTGPERTSAGTVGYWEKDWDGQKVWETGWFVLPEFQGRGIATAATRLVVEHVSRLHSHRYLYAFPSVENGPSNAICRKLGFTLLQTNNFEYPSGSSRYMRCNVWQLDLIPVWEGRPALRQPPGAT